MKPIRGITEDDMMRHLRELELEIWQARLDKGHEPIGEAEAAWRLTFVETRLAAWEVRDALSETMAVNDLPSLETIRSWSQKQRREALK